MISVNSISKSYGEIRAVNNITFNIRDGEITGLLGPNGAGKTTTLRMLTCYLDPDNGTIVVDDFRVDVDSINVRKRIGYLPESNPLYGDMLVHDYLKFIAEIRGIVPDNINSRIGEMGDTCGINEVMHMNISELSKGYKQRVGLASAMIHDPEILILDEPTSGLDPNQIVEIRDLIREIGRKKTVILSTHILSEVEATCDRVIIIDKGNIIIDDRTENLQNVITTDRSITIKVSGTDFSSLNEELKKLDGVLNVADNHEEDLLSVNVTASMNNDIRPEIFKLVIDNNWILYEMKQEKLSLEHIFRKLTAGGGNA